MNQLQQFNTSKTINSNNNQPNSRKTDADNYSVSNIVLSLGFANGIAALCSTPLEVVKVSEIRSCLQKVNSSNSVTIQGGAPTGASPVSMVYQLYRNQGIGSLFRGCQMTSTCGFAKNCIFMYVYEQCKKISLNY